MFSFYFWYFVKIFTVTKSDSLETWGYLPERRVGKMSLAGKNEKGWEGGMEGEVGACGIGFEMTEKSQYVSSRGGGCGIN